MGAQVMKVGDWRRKACSLKVVRVILPPGVTHPGGIKKILKSNIPVAHYGDLS
jgi:hypothetical protein